jgi:hypothetical protein
MTTKTGLALLFTMLAALIPAAEAHHSAAPHYDLSRTLVLDATVTKFEFVNPHAYVYFTASGKDGKPADWRCELQARTALTRLGWTTGTFVPGHRITVKGSPAWREDNVCFLASFVREDGREIGRNEDFNKPGSNPPAALTAQNRETRLSDGHPNLQGPWIGIGGPEGRGRGGPDGRGPRGPGGPEGRGPLPPPRGGRGPLGPPGSPELTEAGVLAREKYDERFDDPAIRCNPANILFGWTHDRHVNDIVQTRDKITLKYGYMDFVRTISMNMSEHPKNINSSTAGHSIGRWEADVLVVDTIGFVPGVLIPIAGIQHSEKMHVVERFSVDGKNLKREYRAEDPLYLKTAYTGMDLMTLSAEPYTPYNCVELSGKNNMRLK